MSKVLVTESHLTNIAEAIRLKNGASTTYRPGDMAAAIQALDTSGIHPTGTKQIATNGTHDVTQYASANVNVQPNLQSKTAIQNGTVTPDQGYDGLSSVVVNVSGGGGSVSDNALLYHFDGNMRNSGNWPTIFEDKTGLSISNEHSKFGETSLKTYANQTNNNVMLEVGFSLGTDDFTLDFWCYPENLPDSASSFVVPVAFKYRSIAIYLAQRGMQFGIAKVNNTWFNVETNAVQLSNNQWYHIALVRDGTMVYGFINGVKIKTVDFGSDAWAPITNLTLGSNSYSPGDRRFNGYIDELRLKIGEAVWTSDFTPPTQPYT